MVNVTIYSIHGSYGLCLNLFESQRCVSTMCYFQGPIRTLTEKLFFVWFLVVGRSRASMTLLYREHYKVWGTQWLQTPGRCWEVRWCCVWCGMILESARWCSAGVRSNMFDLAFWSRFACEKPMMSWCDQPQATAWLLLQLIFLRGSLLSVWLLCNLKVLHWIPFWAWSELNSMGKDRQHRFGILCYKVVSGNFIHHPKTFRLRAAWQA